MPTATYMHGVTWKDVPTSIVAPVTADSGIPVVVGKAPSNLAGSNAAPPNKPRIYYTYEEAVAEMGFDYDFNKWTLCEAMYVFFVLYNIGPIILSNIVDLTKHIGTPVVAHPVTLVNSVVDTGLKDVILTTVAVKNATGTITYVSGTDYIASFSDTNTLIITAISGGQILASDTLHIDYNTVNVSTLTKQDIIGGVDSVTGMGTGLEVVEDVFPTLSVVPGNILTPGYAQDPEVFAVMTSKADLINNCFRCGAVADIDSVQILKAMDVFAWKQTNNYYSHRCPVNFPRVGIDEKTFWMSTHQAALMELTDYNNDHVPVESPSNKLYKINRTVVGSLTAPTDYIFGKGYADMLNGQGICTTINWIGGWKCWGNNESIYPSSSDPHERWIPVRRMTDWVGNTLVLTCYQFVDNPGNRRLIESIVDSVNIWLNSLVAAGYSLGARVEFRQDENSDTDLLAGHYTFHVYEAFPTPAEWIEFLIEFDVSYLANLFTPTTTAVPVG